MILLQSAFIKVMKNLHDRCAHVPNLKNLSTESFAKLETKQGCKQIKHIIKSVDKHIDKFRNEMKQEDAEMGEEEEEEEE